MPGGRPKGSSSAYSLKMRTTIAALLDKKADDIERWLDDIEANEGPLVAMKVVQDLLEYAMPKLARIEHAGDEEAPVVFRHDEKLKARLLAEIPTERLQALADEGQKSED